MNKVDAYLEAIAGDLQDLEERRQVFAKLKKKRLKSFNWGVSVVTLITALYAGYFFNTLWVSAGLVLTVFIVCALFQENIVKLLLNRGKISDFEALYKKKLVGGLVTCYDVDLTYDPKGKMSNEELLSSHLFHFGTNTNVRTDDLIKGEFNGHDLAICNVKVVSNVRSGNSVPGQSNQNFNGLMVRLKADIEGEAFLIPKSKTASSLSGLSQMKFLRDPNMSVKEQKAHNLAAMTAGMGGYSWNLSLTSFANRLTSFGFAHSELKPYEIYADSTATYESITKNQQLIALLSESFSDQGALDELVQTESFKILDNRLLDRLMRTTLTYAIHSGYVWVLLPALQDKFEIDLDVAIGKETVMEHHRDLQLSLLSISPFLPG